MFGNYAIKLQKKISYLKFVIFSWAGFRAVRGHMAQGWKGDQQPSCERLEPLWLPGLCPSRLLCPVFGGFNEDSSYRPYI